MVLGTRNELQARVDANCDVLKRLILSVPQMIRASFEEVENEAKEVALHNCDFDKDVYNSIVKNILQQTRPEEEEWMVMEFNRSMALTICSFAESSMKSMINGRIGKRNWSFRALEDFFYKIKTKYELSELPEIQELWPNYGAFLDKRNDITHGFKEDKDYDNHKDVIIDQNELLLALDGAHRLLRSTADAIDIKLNGKRDFVNYLWTPTEL